ncbi:uncharacterized protein LOC124456670 isoform X2 [Xenia sp. Carnegie-2017]|uniref:uncharacterized protein LOC124456670 isoform X2 n=1 Tax=Xenia sp. Carnegie-2017 TaxID=2897299 RepID=UPI001F04B464|nr:uncharacterized protein LOC124456670 isoform X2 [Xenia sp. Carnegie-2017]
MVTAYIERALRSCLEKADVFESDNMVFSAAASDVALGDGYDRHDKTSRSQVVTREAIRNASNCCYSSLLCMFALSSVTGMKVRSVYPDTLGETSKYAKFLNGQILPRVEHSLFEHADAKQTPELVFLWSAYGASSLPALETSFKVNHFGPLIPFYVKESVEEIIKSKAPKKQVIITDVFTSGSQNRLTSSSSANINDAEQSCRVSLPRTSCLGTLKRDRILMEAQTESHKKKRLDVSEVDPLDIGNFVGLANIDDDTKFNLLQHHWKPPHLLFFIFVSLAL